MCPTRECAAALPCAVTGYQAALSRDNGSVAGSVRVFIFGLINEQTRSIYDAPSLSVRCRDVFNWAEVLVPCLGVVTAVLFVMRDLLHVDMKCGLLGNVLSFEVEPRTTSSHTSQCVHWPSKSQRLNRIHSMRSNATGRNCLGDHRRKIVRCCQGYMV